MQQLERTMGVQYENIDFKHPRESEIIDVMQFLEFSMKSDASYSGSFHFHFVEPATEPVVYVVATDSKAKQGTSQIVIVVVYAVCITVLDSHDKTSREGGNPRGNGGVNRDFIN